MKYREFIPVEIYYTCEEKPLWGRILEISENQCIIISKYDFKKYKKIYLTFSIEDTRFENIALKIKKIEKDDEYYFYYYCSLSEKAKEEIKEKINNSTKI